MIKHKSDLIAEARRKKEEAERKEQERKVRLEQERINRLLADAAALRQACDIRAYVQAVRQINETSRNSIGDDAFTEWEQWALAQADRIDPVASGKFRETMKARLD